jgi:hypothetical protein
MSRRRRAENALSILGSAPASRLVGHQTVPFCDHPTWTLPATITHFLIKMPPQRAAPYIPSVFLMLCGRSASLRSIISIRCPKGSSLFGNGGRSPELQSP